VDLFYGRFIKVADIMLVVPAVLMGSRALI